MAQEQEVLTPPQQEQAEPAHDEATQELGHAIVQAAQGEGANKTYSKEQTTNLNSAHVRVDKADGQSSSAEAVDLHTRLTPGGKPFKHLSLFKHNKNGNVMTRDVYVDEDGAKEYGFGKVGQRPEEMSTRRVKAATRLVNHKFGLNKTNEDQNV